MKAVAAKYLGALIFVAGLGLIAYLVFRFGLEPIGRAWTALGWHGLAIVVAVHLPVAAILGAAWWVIGHGTAHARLHKFIWGRLVRDSAAEVLPFSQVGGYVLGARALSLSGVDGFTAAITTVVDLIIELAAKLPYIVVGLFLLAWLKPESDLFVPVAGGVLVSVALLAAAVMLKDRTRGVLERMAVRLGARWPALGLGDEKKTLQTVGRVFENGHGAASGFALHLAAWLLGALELWIALHLMGQDISFAEAIVIDSLFTGLRTLAFFVPGAVGIQEAGYVLLCGMFGIGAPVAIAFSFIRRARDFLIGGPVLLLWQTQEGRRSLVRRTRPAVTP